MLDIQGRKYASVTVCDVTLYDLVTKYPPNKPATKASTNTMLRIFLLKFLFILIPPKYIYLGGNC